MCIILGYTRDSPNVAMRLLFYFPTTINIWSTRAYVKVGADTEQPLHLELALMKREDRLRRGKTWMSLAENIVKQAFGLISINHGVELAAMPAGFGDNFYVIIKLDRTLRERNTVRF